MTDRTDSAIQDRFVSGDPEVHDRVRRWIEPVVRGGSWRFSDAEGVVQEVLIKLLTILREGRFEATSSFRTFVVSVTRNSCIDVYRREKYRGSFHSDVPVEETAPASGRDPERALRTRERFRGVMYIFQNLPEDCRRLWRLVYGERLGPSEAARHLGISAGAARVRVHRCLEKARALGRRHLAAPAG